MDSKPKPIYLFADSQLLFWHDELGLFLESLTRHLGEGSPKAAYIGASNDDDPVFYQLFRDAMAQIQVRDCRMILKSYSEEDAAFVEQAKVILLAGGDVMKGWEIFERTGLVEVIRRRYLDGALLIGISAGAIQLGRFCWPETFSSADDLTESLRLVPCIISVHETNDWPVLTKAVEVISGDVVGIGIPTGGGAIYFADQSLEAIRHSLFTFTKHDGTITRSLLMPNRSAVEMESVAEN